MTDFGANKTVLVVDDDKHIRDSVVLILSRQGCFVQAATDAATAFQIVEADAPDVVLLDIDLPNIDIAAFNARLRALAPSARLLLTTREECAKNAPHGFELLTKPFEENELIEAVGPCAA